MNYLTTALITLSLSLTATASATDIVAKDDTRATKLCLTAVQGNRAAMYNAIKASGYSKHYVVNNIKCNNQHITEFVAQHGKSPDRMNAILNNHRSTQRVSITDLAKL
jgi:hypothetical protein